MQSLISTKYHPVIGTPFRNTEEAWFWFICAVEARRDGAVPGRGRGDILRPCEPSDILRILERLHRNRRLRMEHLNVLSHYGRRRMRPSFGYIMAITWGAQMLSIAYTIIVAPENSAKVMAGMADLSTIWGVGLAVLGIYVYRRGKYIRDE